MSKFITILDENRYEVSFDEEKLREFRDKVIEEASIVTHHDYVGHNGPFYGSMDADPREIRNYSAVMKGSDKNGNLIRFVYDRYTFPALATHIRNLIEGDNSAFEKIYFPTYKDEHIPLLSEIKTISEEILSSGESEIAENKIEHVNELIALLIKYRNGEYEIPIKKYYEDARYLFDVKELSKCKTLTKE